MNRIFRQVRYISLRSRSLSGHSEGQQNNLIKLTWKRLKDGNSITTDGWVGMNIMRSAQRAGIELEGSCEGVCACCTCHVILEDDVFDALETPEEIEEDMLDQAFGLKETSRLGCQITLTKEHDGMVVTIPAATRNFYVDGHVPQPH